jgi:peptide/nickel transport system permease protein
MTLVEHVTAPRRARRRATGAARLSRTSLVVGLVLVGTFVVIGLVSLVWTPMDPEKLDVASRFLPPSGDHLLGTDHLGRDILSQLMVGARKSLSVAVLSTTIALVPGVALGMVAAVRPGLVDQAILRTADVLLGFPGILLALLLAAVMGPGNKTVIVAIVVWMVPGVTRLTRGPAKQILVTDFVSAARAYGRSRPYIVMRHILPNVAPVIIVQASILFAVAILIEAGLSFLGLGQQRPGASWGVMLFEAQPYVGQKPILAVFPGLAITLAALGFNLLGDGLRTLLDPRQRARATGARPEGRA